MTISTSTEGRRTYIVGATYPHRDALRSAGAHWDGSRKAWWLGQRDEAQALVARLSQSEPVTAAANSGPGDDAVVAARATYRGSSCYIAGRATRQGRRVGVSQVASSDGSRVLLYSRDGERQWWGAPSDVDTVRRYDIPQTIGGLRRYAERARAAGGSEILAARRRGWDGKIGSQSYYASGAFDEIDQ